MDFKCTLLSRWYQLDRYNANTLWKHTIQEELSKDNDNNYNDVGDNDDDFEEDIEDDDDDDVDKNDEEDDDDVEDENEN